jgi:hypothetical protein
MPCSCSVVLAGGGAERADDSDVRSDVGDGEVLSVKPLGVLTSCRCQVNSGRQNDQEKKETAMSTAVPPAEVADETTTSASPLMCVLDTTNSIVGDVPSTTTNITMSERTRGVQVVFLARPGLAWLWVTYPGPLVMRPRLLNMFSGRMSYLKIRWLISLLLLTIMMSLLGGDSRKPALKCHVLDSQLILQLYSRQRWRFWLSAGF